jgi:hypothetical protein
MLSGRIRWARVGAVDGELVQVGRETDCSAVLHDRRGCGNSRRGTYNQRFCRVLLCERLEIKSHLFVLSA